MTTAYCSQSVLEAATLTHGATSHNPPIAPVVCTATATPPPRLLSLGVVYQQSAAVYYCCRPLYYIVDYCFYELYNAIYCYRLL